MSGKRLPPEKGPDPPPLRIPVTLNVEAAREHLRPCLEYQERTRAALRLQVELASRQAAEKRERLRLEARQPLQREAAARGLILCAHCDRAIEPEFLDARSEEGLRRIERVGLNKVVQHVRCKRPIGLAETPCNGWTPLVEDTVGEPWRASAIRYRVGRCTEGHYTVPIHAGDSPCWLCKGVGRDSKSEYRGPAAPTAAAKTKEADGLGKVEYLHADCAECKGPPPAGALRTRKEMAATLGITDADNIRRMQRIDPQGCAIHGFVRKGEWALPGPLKKWWATKPPHAKRVKRVDPALRKKSHRPRP